MWWRGVRHHHTVWWHPGNHAVVLGLSRHHDGGWGTVRMGRGVPIPVNGGEVWRTSTVTKSGGLGDELIGNRVWSLTKTKKSLTMHFI